MEGNLHFKIDQASLIVRRQFTLFILFYLVFEGNFQVKAPEGGGGGGLYLNFKGCFNEGYIALRVWGAYTRRGLFSEFYGIPFFLFSLLLFQVICLMCNKVVVVVVSISILRENNMATRDCQNNVYECCSEKRLPIN